MKLTDWATFTIYVQGYNDDGEPTLMKITKSGWVVEHLLPKILLGNDFLSPYGSTIDYGVKAVHVTTLNFIAPFDIMTQSQPCNQKVTSTHTIVLLPGQHAYLRVQYKPLPTDRDFSFESEQIAIVSAVISSKTPKVVKSVNHIDGVLMIPTNALMGHITETTVNGYFATTWIQALRATIPPLPPPPPKLPLS
jgi:hypothetical protein